MLYGYDVPSNKLKVSSKGLKKCAQEQSCDGPQENYCRFAVKKLSITSRNRRFWTKGHFFVTHEQIKERLSGFYPQKSEESDVFLTQSLIF